MHAVDAYLARIRAPYAGTLRNLFVDVASAFGAGVGVTYTVRVNGADTGITCTINGAVAVSASDTTNTNAIAQGALIEVKEATQAGAPANKQTRISLELTA